MPNEKTSQMSLPMGLCAKPVKTPVPLKPKEQLSQLRERVTHLEADLALLFAQLEMEDEDE